MSATHVYGSISIGRTRLGESLAPFLGTLSPTGPEFEQWESVATGSPAFKAFTITVGGKSGAGKSQLINALVAHELFDCDDVMACTRGPQSVFLRAFEKEGLEYGVLLTDLPGVSDGTSEGWRFQCQHENWLSASGAFIYLVKVNDRAFEPDERVLENCTRNRLWIGLSQVDRAPPHNEWDVSDHVPSPAQLRAIRKKVRQTATRLSIRASRVVPCSATEDYNLDHLFARIASSLSRRVGRRREPRQKEGQWLDQFLPWKDPRWVRNIAYVASPVTDPTPSRGIHVRRSAVDRRPAS